MRSVVSVLLSCGCRTLTRLPPMGGRVRFGCDKGLAHGAQLEWVEYRRDGKVIYNQAAAAPAEKEPRAE